MKDKILSAFVLVLFLFSKNAFSENITIQNLEISKIRAVGDYAGTTYDNTIELWFLCLKGVVLVKYHI